MATLEKIRKKSVLLIVIIGAALLAFILGDAITNGRTLFGNGTTVAKYGDTKVDISEYQQRLDMLQSANPDADGQELSQYVINSIIDEKLLDEAAEKLGIVVSDDMVTYFILDQPLEPMQQFVQANVGYMQQIYPNLTQENAQNPRFIHALIFSPEKYGLSADKVEPLKQNWLAMEKMTKAAAARYLYTYLLGGMIQPSNLDKRNITANEYESSTIDFVAKRYTDLSKYKVSDAELKAEYEKRKNYYKVDQPTKTVGFISVKVNPSEADKQAAAKLQAAALDSLKAGKSLGKTLVKAGVQSHKERYSAATIGNPAIAQFLQGDSVSAPAVGAVKAFTDANGSFQIVRVLSNNTTANEGVDVVPMFVAADVLAAVKADLAAGVAADSLAAKYAADKVQVQPSTSIALQNPQTRSQAGQYAAQLDTISAGQVIEIETAPEGTALAYVKSVQPRVPVYDLEIASYTIYPSKETVEKATDALSKYAASNNNIAKFEANAQKNGYTYQVQRVNGSTVGFPVNPIDSELGARYYPMASKIVSWVVNDAKPGDVSAVVSNENSQNPYLYVAIVENEYDDFVPYTDSSVKKELEDIVKRSKAGDEWVKLYSGKGDINATAAAMAESVITDEVVRFAKGQRLQDAKVLARIAGTKAGNNVIVVKGDDGVYAYVVKSKNPATTKMDDNELRQAFTSVFANQSTLPMMLRGNKRMENNLYKMTGSR